MALFSTVGRKTSASLRWGPVIETGEEDDKESRACVQSPSVEKKPEAELVNGALFVEGAEKDEADVEDLVCVEHVLNTEKRGLHVVPDTIMKTMIWESIAVVSLSFIGRIARCEIADLSKRGSRPGRSVSFDIPPDSCR
ncbi:hypothetical protein, conserved [Eimeria tenella]|uniref:Uncharacterized protein n=1 Tax=Eimeria tenella TaxID=5802 RepID=U6KJG6_EIMTE|nr:hypothetical protein, conserved [Eimeria tenella]CDJ38074.1 hypothetical protein, conserved [Eimeria tenella]|eukprot:XP_013228912.1 hypothetical protein, conserved [Eimeria tenella]